MIPQSVSHHLMNSRPSENPVHRWLVSAILAIGCLVPPALAGAEPMAKPNILFIAVDDLRPELGCYGNPHIHSPNIDKLAKSGVVFNRAYCQQAVCLPSRASMITGARPDTTKAWDLSTDFRKAMPDVVTLPQLFKNHGYFSQAMGKICHHGYDDVRSWSVPTLYPKAPHGAGSRRQDPDGPKVELSAKGRGPVIERVVGPDNSLHDGELGDMAIAALKGMKDRKQPFFLAVGFIKPHLPFNAPAKYWDLYDPAKIELAANPFYPEGAPPYAIPPGGEMRSYSGVPAGWPVKDDFARKLRHGYYAAVSYVDAQVGRLMEELDRQGLRDNTIVILWGDHGWKLGEHQAWAKHTNVENDARVPVIVSVPGMKKAGEKANGLVELVDVYPTLADLAGLPLPAHLEGTSFKPLLDEPGQSWKPAAFSQFPRKVGRKNLMGYTMRTDRHRFTKWVDRKDPSKVDAVELYDHETDPQENRNIAGDPANKDLVAKLDAQWKAGWKGAKPGAEPREAKEAAVKPAKVSMDFWVIEADQPVKIRPTLANVPYGEDKMQVLDFWKAETSKPAPLLFFIHGGAWKGNDKDRVTGLREYLAAGISVVSINYRFVQQAQAAGIKPPVEWPLHDAARALQFVRSKAAEWNIDKTRIGASGGSAGACSSLWLAFHDDMANPASSDPVARESTRLSCAGVVGAQTTLDPQQMKEWTANSFYGGHAFGFNGVKNDRLSGFRTFLENREQVMPWIRKYSPYHLVSADDPPVYLHYADAPAIGGKQKDPTHTSNFGVKLKERMREAGVECHLMYLGAPEPEHPDPVKFLIAQLKGT
jgi:arylsulfatase A-like enzyme/acetyl esterase/lipase